MGGKEYPVAQAWAPGAAIAATQQFLGQRAFKKILFRNGLPLVFVFDGLRSADDGSVVVVGDLGAIYDRERTLFRGVRVHPEATLTLDDGGGAFRLYDFYGNVVPAASGRISVPLNGLGYFLRTDASAGSFARLLSAIRAARIGGIDPAEIVAHDLLGALASKPELRLTLTNVLNRPVAGKLDVTLAGRPLAVAAPSVTLKADKTATISIPVEGVAERADNLYPLAATFDAGADGVARTVLLAARFARLHRVELKAAVCAKSRRACYDYPFRVQMALTMAIERSSRDV